MSIVIILQTAEEAQLLPIQIKLVSEGKLTRYQRKQARTNQAILFNKWEQYIAGSISTTRLRQCGRVNGPVVEADSYWTFKWQFMYSCLHVLVSHVSSADT